MGESEAQNQKTFHPLDRLNGKVFNGLKAQDTLSCLLIVRHEIVLPCQGLQ